MLHLKAFIPIYMTKEYKLLQPLYPWAWPEADCTDQVRQGCSIDFDIGGDIVSHPPPPPPWSRRNILYTVMTLMTDKEAV